MISTFRFPSFSISSTFVRCASKNFKSSKPKPKPKQPTYTPPNVGVKSSEKENQTQPELTEFDPQKWVDWELVNFTEEEKKTYNYTHNYGLTHLPYIINEIGAVPEAIAGFTSEQTDKLSKKTFFTNKQFITFLHQVLRDHLHEIDIQEISNVSEMDNGDLVAILDDRKGYYLKNNSDLLMETNSEDLIGNALVSFGKIIPNSFAPSEEYRIYSEDYGLCFFQPWIIAKMGELIKSKYLTPVEKNKMKLEKTADEIKPKESTENSEKPPVDVPPVIVTKPLNIGIKRSNKTENKKE